MDTKALRQKILDLAIRGKLVPQDPNDEPASVLLERIRAEKQQMVKDGKLKPKDIKNDTVIFKDDDNLHYEKFSGGTVKCIEDEIPFDVPNNWEWCRFGSYTLNRDSERKPVSSVQRKKVKKIYDYYGASGVIDQTDSFLFDEELLLIGEDGANLLARTKPIAFLADGKYWVNNHAHCIDSIDKRLLKFICIYINAINLFQYITGSAQPKLNQDNMNKILIPIPPKAEQEKILESIKIILSNINDIDFENRECVVFGKGNKERPVYFDARTKIHLRNYINSRNDDNAALFVSLDAPHDRLNISGVEIRLRQLGRKLGINKVHPHKFRRTVATKAIDKGMPIEQVQSLLGHSQIDTTMHYAMVNQNNVKESHRKFVA